VKHCCLFIQSTHNKTSSCSDSEADTFEEKLAREMEDEYSAEWGIYEQGTGIILFLNYGLNDNFVRTI